MQFDFLELENIQCENLSISSLNTSVSDDVLSRSMLINGGTPMERTTSTYNWRKLSSNSASQQSLISTPARARWLKQNTIKESIEDVPNTSQSY